MPNIRVMHFGLGPIGAAIAQSAREPAGIQDRRRRRLDPAKVGRDLGDVVGLGRRLGIKVHGEAPRALKAAKPRRRRALHELVDQEGDAADRDDPQSEDADRLDDRGAGVSRLHAHPAGAADSCAGRRRRRWPCSAPASIPGFAMDALPIALTAVCERVDRIVRSTAFRTRACGGCRSSRRSAPA